MSLWVAVLVALVLVLGGISAFVIATCLVIIGGVWMMDRLDEWLGKGVLDNLFNVFLGVVIIFMFCVFWYGATAWLMGWE